MGGRRTTGHTTTLLDIVQGAAGAYEPLDAGLLTEMRAAGNVRDLPSGDGFTYVEYFSWGQCSREQAQRDRACRSGGRFGAVIMRGRTVIHLVAGPKFDANNTDTNPLSSGAAILDLVEKLQPIP